MITQFDHLTLSTPSFDRHRALFKMLGFIERFVDHDCHNPEIKRPFVHHYEALHDVALFDAPNSLSIELVHQGNHGATESSMVPIFENIPLSNIVRDSATITLIDGTEVSEARIAGLDVPVYILAANGKGPCTIQSCVIRVTELEKSLATWEALGCTVITRNATQALLSFTSPFLSFVVRFYLIEMPTESRLDSYGFNYVAFVATSASQEQERFLKMGINTTQLCTMAVNNKKLQLFLLYEGMMAQVEIFSVLG